MSTAKILSEIINNTKSFEKLRNSVDGYRVVDKFYDVFPELKKVAEAKRFDGRTLFIRVENSVWRSELNINKETMIKKINKYINKEIIKNIKFI